MLGLFDLGLGAVADEDRLAAPFDDDLCAPRISLYIPLWAERLLQKGAEDVKGRAEA